MAINRLQQKLQNPNLSAQQRNRIETRIGYEQRNQGRLQSGSPTQRPTPMPRGGMNSQQPAPMQPMQPQQPMSRQPMQPQQPQQPQQAPWGNYNQMPNNFGVAPNINTQIPAASLDRWGGAPVGQGQMLGDYFGSNMPNRFAGSASPYVQNLMNQKAQYQTQMPMDNMQQMPYMPQGGSMGYNATAILRGNNKGLL